MQRYEVTLFEEIGSPITRCEIKGNYRLFSGLKQGEVAFFGGELWMNGENWSGCCQMMLFKRGLVSVKGSPYSVSGKRDNFDIPCVIQGFAINANRASLGNIIGPNCGKIVMTAPFFYEGETKAKFVAEARIDLIIVRDVENNPFAKPESQAKLTTYCKAVGPKQIKLKITASSALKPYVQKGKLFSIRKEMVFVFDDFIEYEDNELLISAFLATNRNLQQTSYNLEEMPDLRVPDSMWLQLQSSWFLGISENREELKNGIIKSNEQRVEKAVAKVKNEIDPMFRRARRKMRLSDD